MFYTLFESIYDWFNGSNSLDSLQDSNDFDKEIVRTNYRVVLRQLMEFHEQENSKQELLKQREQAECSEAGQADSPFHEEMDEELYPKFTCTENHFRTGTPWWSCWLHSGGVHDFVYDPVNESSCDDYTSYYDQEDYSELDEITKLVDSCGQMKERKENERDKKLRKKASLAARRYAKQIFSGKNKRE